MTTPFYQQSIFWIYTIAVIVTAVAGSLFTRDALKEGGWYSTIKLPKWTPQRMVFPIVWTILFVLILAGGYYNERQGFKDEETKQQSRLFFALSLIFNALWSYTFFYQNNLKSAIVVNILLILSILGYMLKSPVGRYFFIPYLLWSSFALSITIGVYNLNK